MKAFPRFIASTAGRWLHAVAGTALIIWGVSMDGTGGTVVAVIGIVPLAAGSFDFGVFAPLFGEPLSGEAIRQRNNA